MPAVSSADRPRDASGQLTRGWDAKLADDVVMGEKLRFHQRPWVRRLAFIAVCAAGVAGAVGLGFFNRWHDARIAELARQRQCLHAFLRSAEFGRFTRAMDAQFVATLNFIAARPHETHPLIPAIAARDKSRHEIPWTLQVLPLPVSTSEDPAKVAQAARQVNALLAQRGHIVDDAARRAARQVFLRTLVPYAQKFIEGNPGNVFHAVFLDRSMQDDALAMFARHHGPGATVADTERSFALYAAIGPAMWQAIEKERTARRWP